MTQDSAPLHPQLRAIMQELAASTTRAARLVDHIDDGGFHRRPRSDRWSIAECLDHLNLTTRAYLPRIDDALQIGRLMPMASRRRYRRDFFGWLLCHMAEPPYRLRAATTPRFIPSVRGGRADVLAEFVRLQQELTARLYRADGLDLATLMIVSPFDNRLAYHMYSCFRILPTHQRRHLWQGEQVLKEIARQEIESTGELRLASAK